MFVWSFKGMNQFFLKINGTGSLEKYNKTRCSCMFVFLLYASTFLFVLTFPSSIYYAGFWWNLISPLVLILDFGSLVQAHLLSYVWSYGSCLWINLISDCYLDWSLNSWKLIHTRIYLYQHNLLNEIWWWVCIFHSFIFTFYVNSWVS